MLSKNAPKRKAIKYRKAPQAPKRGKSAFILFSMAKHPEMRRTLDDGSAEKTPNVAKRVSEAWRNLSAEERTTWEAKAYNDKMRYEAEKSVYTGPWKLPSLKRAKKDPSAPKRPMSAFLSFSKQMRSQARRDNPDKSNTELSQVLATLWKAAPEEERTIHIEQEAEQRAVYKLLMAEWRKARDEDLAAERKRREEIAFATVGNICSDKAAFRDACAFSHQNVSHYVDHGSSGAHWHTANRSTGIRSTKDTTCDDCVYGGHDFIGYQRRSHSSTRHDLPMGSSGHGAPYHAPGGEERSGAYFPEEAPKCRESACSQDAFTGYTEPFAPCRNHTVDQTAMTCQQPEAPPCIPYSVYPQDDDNIDYYPNGSCTSTYKDIIDTRCAYNSYHPTNHYPAIQPPYQNNHGESLSRNQTPDYYQDASDRYVWHPHDLQYQQEQPLGARNAGCKSPEVGHCKPHIFDIGPGNESLPRWSPFQSR